MLDNGLYSLSDCDTEKKLQKKNTQHCIKMGKKTRAID